MPAFLIADVEVTDPERYAQYKALSSLAIEAHDAVVHVRGGAVSVLEGDRLPERVVVLEFPSVEKAQAFYDSPEYVRARAARAGAATMHMFVVEGSRTR